ncbi:MAG: aminotransferase class I/II-fold pyridoxal phosphate-dependent enzyme [Planctomycetota bacterium]
MKLAARLSNLPAYAFAEMDRLRDERRASGADVIDFGVGDPTDPTPHVVVQATAAALEPARRAGYPSGQGSVEFRAAVAGWYRRRYDLVLDPETEITSSVGSKEAIFHLPEAFVDPGDVVLLPSPGYPPYVRGTLFAEGRPRAYGVRMEGPVLPDLDALPPAIAERLSVVWITQPHVPTGRFASLPELERLAAQCRARRVLLCSDEAYSELWLHEPVPTALATGREQVLVFQSLSKRAAMTGWRVGFLAGDARAIAAFKRLKANVDSGTPNFVQAGAIAALADEEAPAEARRAYAERARALVPALRRIGCTADVPSAGFYLWVGAPRGLSGVDFARQLLAGPTAIAVLPGEWLAEAVEDGGPEPGAGRVRLALVPSLARCQEAARRLVESP